MKNHKKILLKVLENDIESLYFYIEISIKMKFLFSIYFIFIKKF